MPARSAGILLYRRPPLEVLLVHPGGPFFQRRDAGVWGIPKGQHDLGEAPLACALREFAEETGQPLEPVDLIDLGEIRQRGGKVVTAWAVEGDLDVARLVSNTFRIEWPPRSGREQEFPEVDRAGWFALPAAAATILPAQRPLLERLAAALDSDRLRPGRGGGLDPTANGGPMADEDEDGGAVGDTEEVHDTIHPGDLPLGHPGREAAEEQFAEQEENAGLTQHSEEPG